MRERADILYRPFEPGDFEAVAELMRAQWSCDLEGAAGEYSASIDLCGYLADADWGLVAEGRFFPTSTRRATASATARRSSC